ncbi:hypothetical protein ACSBOB_04425 [Mesorhizobium sp. ASY16-5R]|uniref:hypothetical protein n=1 Tax=Mesorhizobium sp. ASY16-5R TaxID=3445772 RepID=UPI003FA0285A
MSLPVNGSQVGLPGDGKLQRNLLWRYLSRFDDGEVIRWAFRGLLIGAIGVLAMDLRDLAETNGWALAGIASPADPAPVLPPAVDIGVPEAPSTDPRPFLTTDEGVLGKPMSFTLEPGGRLRATGSIQPGTADRFAAEMSERGEYVKLVSLNSPGGALDDAMAMARLIRERGLDTEVGDGALCASSCPLLMAGGRHRAAGEKAAIGVHQFYAATAIESAPAQIMADAQATTARISRHLASMDVDPALWLHALDTPPRALYYFSRQELANYRLVTASDTKTARKK